VLGLVVGGSMAVSPPSPLLIFVIIFFFLLLLFLLSLSLLLLLDPVARLHGSFAAPPLLSLRAVFHVLCLLPFPLLELSHEHERSTTKREGRRNMKGSGGRRSKRRKCLGREGGGRGKRTDLIFPWMRLTEEARQGGVPSVLDRIRWPPRKVL